MPKANIVRPDGTKIVIEGSVAEIAALLQSYEGEGRGVKSEAKPHGPKKTTGKTQRKIPRGPTAYILALRDEGFFKTRRSLGDIQKKLEESGHIYAQTSLSPVLVRLVRPPARLRRLKSEKGWAYVSV